MLKTGLLEMMKKPTTSIGAFTSWAKPMFESHIDQTRTITYVPDKVGDHAQTRGHPTLALRDRTEFASWADRFMAKFTSSVEVPSGLHTWATDILQSAGDNGFYCDWADMTDPLLQIVRNALASPHPRQTSTGMVQFACLAQRQLSSEGWLGPLDIVLLALACCGLDESEVSVFKVGSKYALKSSMYWAKTHGLEIDLRFDHAARIHMEAINVRSSDRRTRFGKALLAGQS
jgi:hypothetical protein